MFAGVHVFFQLLGELSLVDADPFMKYLPSQVAASAFILANYTVTGGSWVSSVKELFMP